MSHFDRKGMYTDYVRRLTEAADKEVCTGTVEPVKTDSLTMEKLLEAMALIQPLKGSPARFMRDLSVYGSATWRWNRCPAIKYYDESSKPDIGIVRKIPMTATQVTKATEAHDDLVDAMAINYSRDMLEPLLDHTLKAIRPEILATPNVDKKDIAKGRQAVIMQGGYEMTPSEAEALARQLMDKAKEVRKFNAGPYVRPFQEKY